MKNKGFTLVELLAVIAVLLILITLITPKVINQLNSSEDVTQKKQIDELINIAKIYTNQNTEKLPENNSISVITIQELKESGLINKSQILDPKTKEELTGCILIKDENNKYNYEYNEDICNNLITVTFDPQGGQLDQTSKNVIPNETYGILPTPTREGYTFMGWRGKNMFDEETILMAILNATHENGYYNFHANRAHTLYGAILQNGLFEYIGTSSINICFNENTKYTFSIKGHTDFYTPANIYETLFFGIIYDDKTRDYINISSENDSFKSFSSDVNKKIQHVYLSYGRGSVNSHVAYIQLEEGDTATEYEPYQEYTSSTTVTKQENHTLYAIWQANE